MDNYTQFLEETVKEQSRMINYLSRTIHYLFDIKKGGSDDSRSNTKECEVGDHEIFASS